MSKGVSCAAGQHCFCMPNAAGVQLCCECGKPEPEAMIPPDLSRRLKEIIEGAIAPMYWAMRGSTPDRPEFRSLLDDLRNITKDLALLTQSQSRLKAEKQQHDRAVCSLRAHYDSIVEMLHVAQDERDALRVALSRYGQHLPGCKHETCRTCGWWEGFGNHYRRGHPKPCVFIPNCTCGLANLLAQGAPTK